MQIDTTKYYLLGTIAKTFGIKGEVAIYIDADDSSYYKSLETIFLHRNDFWQEFKVKSCRINKQFAYVALDGINDMTEAERYLKYEVWLPEEKLRKLGSNEFYLHDIRGYKAIDINDGEIGIIKEILEYPQQRLFVIISKYNQEILIPVQTELIDKIDKENKILFFNTPEGFLNIYLSPSEKDED